MEGVELPFVLSVCSPGFCRKAVKITVRLIMERRMQMCLKTKAKRQRSGKSRENVDEGEDAG